MSLKKYIVFLFVAPIEPPATRTPAWAARPRSMTAGSPSRPRRAAALASRAPWGGALPVPPAAPPTPTPPPAPCPWETPPHSTTRTRRVNVDRTIVKYLSCTREFHPNNKEKIEKLLYTYCNFFMIVF